MKKHTLIILFLLVNSFGVLSQPCLPDGIYFSNQAQIDSFPINYPNCTEIEGTVTISGWNIVDLRFLNMITHIGGSLRIFNNNNLTALDGLDNLTGVGESLVIGMFDDWNFGNYSLSSISSLSNLKYVGGDCYIADNSALPSLEGLDSLETIGEDLVIQFSNLFDNLNGLGSLDTVGGSLMLRWNNSPISLNGLDNIVFIGGLGITSNDSLTNLSGLENLEAIGGGINISSNPLLTDLAGLENLSAIPGTLQVNWNPGLTSLDGLNSLNSIDGNIVIKGNSNLNDLSGLENIVSVEDITIEENANMNSLQGLMNLTTAHDINIKNNPSLKTINSFGSLEKLTGQLFIMYNDSLIDLTGFNQLDTINGELWIRINPSLVSLNGLDNLTYVGDLVSIWAEKIESLQALSNLHYIGDGLDIEHTDSLRTLEGLEGLYGIKGNHKNNNGLCLIDNAALEDISALMNLTGLKWISIRENHVLESLSGLDHINPNGIFNLSIENNDLLSECEVLSICQYLLDGGDNTIVNNETGCDNVDEVIESCAWVQVPEEPLRHEITIEPNPAGSVITISLSSEYRVPGAGCRLALYDISGHLITEFRFEKEKQINVSNLPSGIYFLEARTEKVVARGKFIKK